jgi:hypothetical protein
MRSSNLGVSTKKCQTTNFSIRQFARHLTWLCSPDQIVARSINIGPQKIDPQKLINKIGHRAMSAPQLTPSVTLLAKDGKAALCHHLLVSHQCLRDILSGMAYADLAVKYPRSSECLENCPCTDIWEINERAARIRLKNRSLKSFILPSLKTRRQDLPKSIWIHTTSTLLFAPTSHAFEAPLANFFTKQRLSQVLRGFNVSICRHMRYSDNFVLNCYEPRGVIDRDRCGPGKPCCCSVTRTDWGGSRCLEEDCMAQFVFCVIHAKAREESRLFPAEPGESLAIVTSKSFPVETTMHPSWTGCALAPDEFDNNVLDYDNWSVHRRKCAIENRQFYNQACIEKLNRTAGANVACYYGNTEDHFRAPEQAPALARTSGGIQELSEVEQVSEDSPPPYST